MKWKSKSGVLLTFFYDCKLSTYFLSLSLSLLFTNTQPEKFW